MTTPYYSDSSVTLYHGRMEEVMQDFAENEWADAVITDPPYGETSLEWDRWPKNWPTIVGWHTESMWCFGSMRMFKRVHELALHFYTGDWSSIHHGPDKHTRARDARTPHTGIIGPAMYEDDGSRLVRTVIKAQSVRGGIHPTEKPPKILAPLIEYSVPVGGLVLDPFAGSGSTLLTARSLGRRAIGIEANEQYCEAAAKRLDVPDLFGGAA